jgi:hypothetical protein
MLPLGAAVGPEVDAGGATGAVSSSPSSPPPAVGAGAVIAGTVVSEAGAAVPVPVEGAALDCPAVGEALDSGTPVDDRVAADSAGTAESAEQAALPIIRPTATVATATRRIHSRLSVLAAEPVTVALGIAPGAGRCGDKFAPPVSSNQPRR